MRFFQELRPALSLVMVLTILTGFMLPVAFTGLVQLALPYQANGSLIIRAGHITGSALIGQNFTSARYFQPRPSALAGTNQAGSTIATPYDAAQSGASNLAPTSAALQSAIRQRVAAYIAAFGPGPVPVDAVTASASGLDPDISLANAARQAPAVAQQRHLPASQVLALVNRLAHRPVFGIIGTAHVNVLKLNLALDALSPS